MPRPPLPQHHRGHHCRRLPRDFPAPKPAEVGLGAGRSSRSLPTLVNQAEEERSDGGGTGRGGGYTTRRLLPAQRRLAQAAPPPRQGSRDRRPATATTAAARAARREPRGAPSVPAARRAVPSGSGPGDGGGGGEAEKEGEAAPAAAKGFCVRVPARRGALRAPKQLSHYLHWL